MGRSGSFVFLIDQYLTTWLLIAAVVVCLLFAVEFAVRAVRQRPDNAFALVRDVLLEMISPNVLGSLSLYFALAVFMGAFNSMKTLLPYINGFWADPWLARLDRAIHFGHDPWRLLQPLLGHPSITRVIEFIYGPIWMACVTLIPLYFCMTRRNLRHRQQFLIAFIATWIVNGIIIAALFMSGGPAFYGLLFHDKAPFGELVRYLNFDAGSTISAAREQAGLWRAYQTASPNMGAGISAFPSLHVSMALLFCFGFWKICPPTRVALIGFVAITAVGSVHLAYHYAVGDYFVVPLMAALWWISGRIVASIPEQRFAEDAAADERDRARAGGVDAQRTF